MKRSEWHASWELITSPFVLFLIVLVIAGCSLCIWVEARDSSLRRGPGKGEEREGDRSS